MNRPHRQRHQKPAPTPPAGLAAAFKMLDMDAATAIAARSHATSTYPHAMRIIEILNSDCDSVGATVQQELDRAAEALYGSCYNGAAHQEPQLASFTGFHVGFAVCWLLLMAVNGKDGAR